MKLSKMIKEALLRGDVEFSLPILDDVHNDVFGCSVGGVVASGMSPKEALSGALDEWERVADTAEEDARAPSEPALVPVDREVLIQTLFAMVRRAGAEMPGRLLREAFEADLAALMKDHGIEAVLPPAKRESR